VKTYIEQASDIVTAMINKGYLRVAINKGDDWKKYNHESIHTVGWAIEEMVRELKEIPEKVKRPRPKPAPRPNAKIILPGQAGR